jgi:aminoglycoside 6'-N-acetyltransferase I
MSYTITPASAEHLPEWAALRYALWTWDAIEDHAEEAEKLYLSGNPDRSAWVVLDSNCAIIAFAEATVRRDYVEGCETSPVVFLEGIYVIPEARQTGVARALARGVADWGRVRGCSEFASNALLDNHDSHAFHAAIGFAETERVVFFKRSL